MKANNLKKYRNRNPLHRFLLNRFLKKVTEMVKETGTKKVLDVGCGEGFIINHLQSEIDDIRITGIDIDQSVIDKGKELFPDLNLKIGDANNIDYSDNSFDLVLCMEMLEHTDNPAPTDTLKELKRVSSNYCIISVPNEPHFRICNLLRLRNITRLGNYKEHMNKWSTGSFKKLLIDAGFEIVKESRPIPWQLYLVK